MPRSLDIVGMPLLEAQLLALDPQTLADVHVLYVNHPISEALMVQRAVEEAFRFVGHTFVPRTQRLAAPPEQWPPRCPVP
ncbi:MAG: hypothetical protein ACRDZ4_05715 [Egibacteraceae bacterium]